MNEREHISKLSLEAILQNMGIQIDQEELMRHILSIQPSYKED